MGLSALQRVSAARIRKKRALNLVFPPMSANNPEIPSTFSPSEIEAPLYQKWLDAGYFTADAKSEKPPFTIVIPPPNVTGVPLA